MDDQVTALSLRIKSLVFEFKICNLVTLYLW